MLSPFTLVPDIDTEALSDQLQRDGVVQIDPFIESEAAKQLVRHLQGRDDWNVVLSSSGEQALRFPPATWQGMSEAQRQASRKSVPAKRDDGFHYIYRNIPVTGGVSPRSAEPDSVLGLFADFIASDEVLDVARQITGADDICFADAQATAYGPGDHLTIHDDQRDEHNRRAAYVFGLTERWRPEWGGLLLFHDDRGDVITGKLPRMNVLTLFGVPRKHSVSAVAPFAPELRYSVTGWFRAPPG